MNFHCSFVYSYQKKNPASEETWTHIKRFYFNLPDTHPAINLADWKYKAEFSAKAPNTCQCLLSQGNHKEKL